MDSSPPDRSKIRATPDVMTPRVRARLLYVSGNLSLVELAGHPLLTSTHKRTLERWCAEDKWVRRRREVEERLCSDVSRNLHADLLAIRLAAIGNILALHEQAAEVIRGGTLTPRSWAEASAVLLRSAQLVGDLSAHQSKAGTEVASESAEALRSGQPVFDSHLSEDEYQLLAHELLRMEISRQDATTAK